MILKTRKINIFYLLIIVLLTAISCKNDEEDLIPDDPNPSNPINGENFRQINGNIDISDIPATKDLFIETLAGNFEANNNGQFTISVPELEKQVIFVEDENEDFIYAAFAKEDTLVINASTTAEVIFGMMPWTAHTEFESLNNVFKELQDSEPFLALVESISNSVQNGVSPVNNDAVISELDNLLASFSSTPSPHSRIPEVDYWVEPQIKYQENSFYINNDGTTTAAWGLEVLDFKDSTSLAGNLILVGNQVSFPSRESIWDYLWNDGSASKMVFNKASDLEIPLGQEGKYRMRFAGPMRGNSSLNFEAAYYNILTSIDDVFNALSVSSEDENPTKESCKGNLYQNLIDSIVSLLLEEELTVSVFYKELYEYTKSGSLDILNCNKFMADLLEIEVSTKEKYILKCLKFLDAYSKLETAFQLGKKFGDMSILNDIAICRQVIDGEAYPCFQLAKTESLSNKELGTEERIKLTVGTKLDIEPEVPSFPEGVKITWKVKEGDGVLQSEKTNVGTDGIAEVWFTSGEEENQLITASIHNKDGIVIDEVEYKFKVSNQEYKLQIGRYEDYSSPAVPIITVGNGDSLTLPNYMTHLVRLTLNDIPVLVGTNGSQTGWTSSEIIGNYPESGEDVFLENYKISVYDATNEKNVSITVNLTLKNKGYQKFVNSNFNTDYAKYGVPQSVPKKIELFADGTYKVSDSQSNYTDEGTYQFLGYFGSATKIQCGEYQETKLIQSVIKLSGGNDGYFFYGYPDYILLFEDGTLGPRGSYGCKTRSFSWIIY